MFQNDQEMLDLIEKYFDNVSDEQLELDLIESNSIMFIEQDIKLPKNFAENSESWKDLNFVVDEKVEVSSVEAEVKFPPDLNYKLNSEISMRFYEIFNDKNDPQNNLDSLWFEDGVATHFSTKANHHFSSKFSYEFESNMNMKYLDRKLNQSTIGAA